MNGRTIDLANLELRRGDAVQPLTLMEAKLLRHLIEHEGQAVSRKTILEDVWGLQEDTDTLAIDNFIVRLRKYLEELDLTNPERLRPSWDTYFMQLAALGRLHVDVVDDEPYAKSRYDALQGGDERHGHVDLDDPA